MAAGKIFAISFAINAALGGSFSSTMSRAGGALASLRSNTSQLNAAQRRLDAAWRSSQQAAQAYQQEVQRLRQQYASGEISQSQYRAAVASAGERMRAAGMSAEEYRSHMQRLRQEAEQSRAAQARLSAAMATQAAASSRFGEARAAMTSAFATGAMVAAPFVGAVETAANFEAAMSKVQAITRASSGEMESLTANARMLGETTQFSATQAAEAMSYLGMAGWNTEQIIAGMPGLLNLAAAGGTDLARTADIVSDDLTAFGLSADQAGHMADVFAVTVTRTNTNVEMLGETMKYAAPVAKAFGVSMEETSALAGLMANSGIKATQAGTALRSGFLRLAGPPKMATKAMQELGLSLSDVTAQQQEAQAAMAALGIQMSDDGGPRKMSAILTELRDKTAGLGQEEKLATLKAIFGTEAATGWLAVLDAGPETFNQLVDAMENSDGEAAKMAETMNNNAKGAMIKLKSAMEGLAISLGNIFLPTLTAAGNGLANMAGSASAWVQKHETMATVILAIVGGLVALMAGFAAVGVAAAAFNYAAASVAVFSATIRAATITQEGMTLAMRAQAGAMTLLRAVTNGDNYRQLANEAVMAFNRMRALTWASVGESIRAGIAGGAAQAGSAFNTMRGAAQSAATAVLNAGSTVLTAARNFSIAGALSTAANGFRALGMAIMAAGRASLAAAFSPLGIALIAIAGAAYLIYSNWSMVGPFFAGLWEQIQASLANAWAMIQPALTALGAAFASLWPAIASLGDTFMAAFDTIAAAVMAGSGPLSMLANVGLTIAEIFGGVLVGAFIVMANITVGAITGAVGIISSIITMLIGVLTGLIDFVVAVFTGNWSAAWDAVGNIVTSVFSGVYNTVMSFIHGIGTAISGIINSAKSLASSLPFGGGGGEVESNARGGIYRKGAFLTTFAEEGPEAAIPLDGSPRAIGLWERAGQILGVGQAKGQRTGQTGAAVQYDATPNGTQQLEQATPAIEQAAPVSTDAVAAPQQATPNATATAQTTTAAPATPVEANTTVTAQKQAAQVNVNVPPINISLTFNGPAEVGKVKTAVMEAGQRVQETFAEQMEKYQREKARVAYV